MPHRSKQLATILDDLRQRICLAQHDEPLVLKETELAAEFGISRTPIRQILQYLSHGGAVETLPGVGTVSVTLNNAERDMHHYVYSNLCLAVASCVEGVRISNDAAVTLMSVENWFSLSDNPSENDFVRMQSRIIEAISGIIEDPLLRTTYQNAHWRVLRWRVLGLRKSPVATWGTFHNALNNITEAAKTCDASHVLTTAAGIGLSFGTSADKSQVKNVVDYRSGNHAAAGQQGGLQREKSQREAK